MLFSDILRLSTRVFRNRPSRTWLTILGMGVGMGAVLFLVSLGYGLQSVLLEKISGDEVLLSLSVAGPASQAVKLDEENLKIMAQNPLVKKVAPLASLPAQLSFGTLTGNTLVRAVDADYFRFAGVRLKEGALWTDEKSKVLISEAILKLFNISNAKEAIGKKVSLTLFVSVTEGEAENVKVVTIPDEFEIAGVAEENQANFIYFPLGLLKEYTPVSEYEMAKVRVNKGEDLDFVHESLIEKGFQVSALSDTLDQANKIFRVIQITLGLLGAIALIVSAIGMVNTMTVTLLERTNEIGIMQAIGASQRDIKAIFLGEAALMGILGGVMGVLIGVGAGEFVNWGLNLLAISLGGKAIRLFVYPIWFVFTIVIFSSLIGLITGFFPARRAAKLDPLAALRYK